MNQTKQEAAEAFSKYPNGQPTLGYHLNDIISAEKRAFIAGAEWEELKWIPVTERLPEMSTPVLCRWPDNSGPFGSTITYHDLVDRFGRLLHDRVIGWCAIPDSLLNFKP